MDIKLLSAFTSKLFAIVMPHLIFFPWTWFFISQCTIVYLLSFRQAIEALDRSRICNEYWDSRPYSRPQGQISQPYQTNVNGGNGQGVHVNQHLPSGVVAALKSLFKKANAEELNSLYSILSDNKPAADRNLIARLLNEEIHKSQPS